MKRFLTRLKVLCAVAASTALVFGSATVLDISPSAQAATTPFTCTSNFYQVSNGNMFEYSVVSNTYTEMAGSTAISNVNAAGYNTADNYIYAITSTGNGAGKSTTLYKFSSDGSHVSLGALSGGGASIAAGDFIGPNELLTVNGTGHTPLGTFTMVNTSSLSVSAFTSTGATWAADDFAFNPSNNTIYGIDGTTLYTGVISGSTVVVSTTTVQNSGANSTSDPWGATYIDSAGNAYFFDNTNFNLVEISAASLASANPSALNITQANTLALPNDGASCPTASSPLAPTVVTTAATSVTLTTASLNGTVETGIPASSNIPTGDVQICYSTSNTLVNGALSVSPVCAATTPSSLAANKPATAATLPVTGLSSGTTYYFQIEATNAYGLEAFGNVLNFTTTAANHTVTFNANGAGATGTMANETNNAAANLTSNAFSRPGYTFSGWNTNADGTSGTNYANSASYLFTADATMYAKWTPLPTHTVTFHANGAGATGTMAAETNNVAANLTANAFSRAGYTFAGWNTNADGTSGTNYADAASYNFTADLDVYAKWTALPSHTVTFNSNGAGATGTMANETNNVAANLTANVFSRPGYTFAGWNTNADGTTGTNYADAASYLFTADATMYAKWNALPSHTVTFNSNGAGATGTMANETNNVAANLTANAFSRTGYTFAGWNTNADGTSGTNYADAASYLFTADATMYAKWNALPSHTVTFNSNGAGATGTMVAETNNVAANLTANAFSRPGYTFAGWNTNADGTSGTNYANSASYLFTADATMYAKWNALPTHTVTFNSNGAGATGTMVAETNNVAANLTSNAFSRPGYTFAGWNTNADGTTGTNYANNASYLFTADATMYAKWNALPTHTVTFHANGAGATGTTGPETNNVTANLTNNGFSRPGYTFAGWNSNADGTSGTNYADAASYDFTADLDLYAKWNALPIHTVTFDSNGAGATGTMADELDNVAANLTSNAFSRPGYTFAGWNTNADGTSGTDYADNDSYLFTADATMYAKWNALPIHTVTFDSNGAGATGTMADESNNVAANLTTNAFSRPGYTFAGWNTNADGTSGTDYADNASYLFTADATMYAKWNALPIHTVTFDSNGAGATGTMADESNNVAANLTANAFSRPGYTFAGWNTNADGTTGTNYADNASYLFTADATMYAKWNALPTHTVTFHANGAGATGTTGPETNNVTANLTNNGFSRPGYTFAGWNSNADGTSGTNYADAASYDFTADLDLYAKWNALPTHTVTFNSNGAGATGTMANESNNVAANLTTNAFSRPGYTFAGWNTNADGTTGTNYANSASYLFTADATMYAKWNALPSHTVTFNSNGAGATGTMANESNNVAANLTSNAFSRPGYTFAGWNTNADGTTGTNYANNASYLFTADATMYAKWNALPTHTVTFHANGAGATGTTGPETNNVTANLTNNGFSRPGYTFAGWNSNADGTSGTNYADAASYDFTADLDLYAKWNALPIHTVTFDSNGAGATGTMADELDNVAANLTSNAFSRPGYTFAGWNTNADGTSGTDYADNDSYLFTADATMYAKWNALPIHTVTFDSNGAGATGTMADELDNVAANLTTNAFSRPGYTFAGWNTNADGTSGTDYADNASYLFTADATMYAKWNALPIHTVTFDSNGAGATGTMADESNNVAANLTANAFSRPGYTFAGWNTNADGTSGTDYADNDSYLFTADATMYAKWNALPIHTVTFDSNGAGATGTMADESNNVAANLTSNAFSRPGYTFAGWNTNADGTSGTDYADNASYLFTADATMYAKWNALPTHTVTFDSNGAGATGTMADESNNVAANLTTNAFSRPGYTFAGWNTNADGTSGTDYADNDSYLFTADATMYAKWNALPIHTVTFDSNGAGTTGTMADESNNVAANLTANAFSRPGYTFSGWNTNADGTSGTDYADNDSYLFTADATMYAKWTALPIHTVTFDSNGAGTTGTMADESNNVAANLTSNAFSRPGYTFSGWNTNADGTSGTNYADAASYLFTADATMYAKWTALPTHTVTFDSNGAGATGTMADELDNVPTALTINSFTRAGYFFEGWNTAANGLGAAYADTASYGFAADATMYAQWSAMPVLTFDVNGGNGSVPPLIADVPTPLPTTTVDRPGYKFIGWNTAPDGSGTEYAPGALYPFSGNGILYAQFTKIILAYTGVDTTPGLTLATWLIAVGLVLITMVALIRRRRRATSR